MTTASSPSPPGQIRIVREMAVTHADFFRGLAPALAGRMYVVQPEKIVISEDGRSIVVTISAEKERLIGALHLPLTRAEFAFSGYTRADAETFMDHLSRHFQRGGG